MHEGFWFPNGEENERCSEWFYIQMQVKWSWHVKHSSVSFMLAGKIFLSHITVFLFLFPCMFLVLNWAFSPHLQNIIINSEDKRVVNAYNMTCYLQYIHCIRYKIIKPWYSGFLISLILFDFQIFPAFLTKFTHLQPPHYLYSSITFPRPHLFQLSPIVTPLVGKSVPTRDCPVVCPFPP